MKYYKAKINIENGLKVYGSLPYKFVIGHEDEVNAYFELLDHVYLPSMTDIEEITFEVYEQNVNAIKQLNEQKKKQENDDAIAKLEQLKIEKEQLWQTVTDLQIEALILNQQLTDAQLEIEMLKGGM